jgi:hypothetical protein
MFKRKVKLNTYATLDALMVSMASDVTYDEYIMLRGKMEER